MPDWIFNFYNTPNLISMNSLFKYMLIGAIIGGILPAILHPLGITIFISVEDILMHFIGMLFGALIGLIIWRTNKK